MLSSFHIWANVLSPFDWCAIAFVILMHNAAVHLGMWVYAIFTLAGTLAHELCHWIVSLLLGANPSFPSIIPEKTMTGWRLGSVEFTPSLIKNIPIALAPFLLAPLALWWAASYLPSAIGWWYVFHAWIVGTLFMASAPSRQDWTIAAPSIALIGVGWWFLH